MQLAVQYRTISIDTYLLLLLLPYVGFSDSHNVPSVCPCSPAYANVHHLSQSKTSNAQIFLIQFTCLFVQMHTLLIVFLLLWYLVCSFSSWSALKGLGCVTWHIHNTVSMEGNNKQPTVLHRCSQAHMKHMKTTGWLKCKVYMNNLLHFQRLGVFQQGRRQLHSWHLLEAEPSSTDLTND